MEEEHVLARLSSGRFRSSIDIFPWNDNFNTGLPEIDGQHRILVIILNVLAGHVAFRSDIFQLTEVLDALTDYTVYHFKAEEAIWHAYFPDDAEHREHLAVHERFVDRVRQLRDEQQRHSSDEIAREALEFLARWLAAHILEKDRYLAYRVLALRAGSSPEQAKAQATHQMGGATRALIDIILSLYSTLSSNTVRLMRELDDHRKTEEAYHEQQRLLEHRERFDGVTGLLNRAALTESLQKAMIQARRNQGSLALVYLDLDGFRAVNDLFGVDSGNRVLEVLAQRLRHLLKPRDTVARLGGDEFVVMLHDGLPGDACVSQLNGLLAAVASPIVTQEASEVRLTASLGVAFYPQELDITADQWIRQADQAMCQAKAAGKNRFHFFDVQHDKVVRGHVETLERIRNGFQQGEFFLHYQPKVNLRTGHILGVEALLRWQHPERGVLMPQDILPLVAGQPQEALLDEWVLDQTLAQIRRWQQQGLSLGVSVNIGGQQLLRQGFTQDLQKRLGAEPPIPASLIELEILETSALEDATRVSRVMEECMRLGLCFSIDDFGTGFSSLSYLKHLPASILKIDRGFVTDMLEDPDDLTILVGILGLADAFRRRVIAEGVETLAQAEMLLDLGCDEVQGYGVAHPMPGDQIPEWVTQWVPPPSCLNRPLRSRDDVPWIMAQVEQRAMNRVIQGWLKGQGDMGPVQNCRERFESWFRREKSNARMAPIRKIYAELDEEIERIAALKLQGLPYEAPRVMAAFSDGFQRIEAALCAAP